MTLRNLLSYFYSEENLKIKMYMSGGMFSCTGSAARIENLDPDVLDKIVTLIEAESNCVAITVR